MATMILLDAVIANTIARMAEEAAPRDAAAGAPDPAAAKSSQPSRWIRWQDAADALPPPPREVAVAIVLGALLVAVSNALAIALTVPLPAAGMGLRLQHHAAEALLTVGIGAWLALPAVVLAWWFARRGRAPERAWPGWLLYAAACTAGMYGLLQLQLRRQAYVVLEGALSSGLFPLYVLLCGLAVPAAHIIACYLARVGWPRYLALLAGLVAVGVDHAVVRDDHPGLHTAVLWVAGCFFGSALADVALRWLARGRRQRLAMGLCGLCGLATLLWHPPNAVRQQLFREPGAISSWVLARLLWRLPALQHDAQAPQLQPLPETVRQRALRGIAPEPIVVIVTVDALRADVLARPDAQQRFPHLLKLQERGASFARATAVGSQTSVSLTSMFSGRYFSQLFWERYGTGRTRFLYPAADESPRFPALLSEAGVGTHSMIGLIFLSEPYGITRGFADERVVVKGRGHGTAAAVLTPMLKALREPNEGPQLYYAHLMEPHEPYTRGKLKRGPAYDRYLSEIELVDRWIGKIVRVLKRRHRGRGYLIVSADHGEAFGEHGTHFHTKTLYEELLRVPLLMWGPGIVKRRIEARASLIDIGPTALHLFRQPAPAGSMGRSLLPLARGQIDALPRPVLAEGRLRRVLYIDDLKVIEDSMRKVVEVYDLKRDPDELDNLFDSDPARSHPAVAALRAFFAEHRIRRPGYTPPYKP